MELAECFPIWEKLSSAQRNAIQAAAVLRSVKKGALIHNGSVECTGVILVQTGQLRAYSLSEDGREITLYRLFEMDMCMLSAACMMQSIQFEIMMEAEKDSTFWIIPPAVYKHIMEQSAAVANYTNEIMASRFSDVMWLMEQILWKSFDKRLASFLLEEMALEGSSVLRMTHEAIGNHLGNPREVVTRMLRYFQGEGAVKLTRGSITVTDVKRLREISQA